MFDSQLIEPTPEDAQLRLVANRDEGWFIQIYPRKDISFF
jgi:hypothetical protein